MGPKMSDMDEVDRLNERIDDMKQENAQLQADAQMCLLRAMPAGALLSPAAGCRARRPTWKPS